MGNLSKFGQQANQNYIKKKLVEKWTREDLKNRKKKKDP